MRKNEVVNIELNVFANNFDSYYNTQNKKEINIQDVFWATRSGKRTEIKSDSKDEERSDMGQ